MAEEPNGRASIREVYALVDAVRAEMADGFRELGESLARHEGEHAQNRRDLDVNSQKGFWTTNYWLTSVGILAALAIGIASLVWR